MANGLLPERKTVKSVREASAALSEGQNNTRLSPSISVGLNIVLVRLTLAQSSLHERHSDLNSGSILRL